MNKDDQFYKDIDFLKKEYKEHPKKVANITADAVNKIKSSNKPLIENKDREVLYIVITCIVIVLFGLINIGNPNIEFGEIMGAYFGGFVFFIAGYLVNFYVKGFGIVFLFSHGMTGFGLMCGITLSKIFSLPCMQDNPTTVYYYLAILGFIALVAILFSIIMNLSDKLRTIKYIKLYPLIGFGFVAFWVQMLPRIIDKLYLINF